MTQTHIYVIAENYSNFIKIGVAENVRSRVNSLQTGNPRPLTARYSRLMPCKRSARYLERKMHALLRERRVGGEWFDYSYHDAIVALEDMLP